MPLPFSFPDCPAVQRNLFPVMDKNRTNPSFPSIDDISFVMALVSPMNTAGTLQEQVNPAPGRQKTVNRYYHPRLPISEAVQDAIKVCTSSNKIGRLIDVVELDDTGISYNVAINPSDLFDMCEEDPEYVESVILDQMSLCLRALDAQLTSDALPLVGAWESTQTGLVGNVLTYPTRDAEGKIDADFITEIEFAAKNAEYQSKPIIIGWNEQWKVFRKLEFGCCTDFGQDIGEIARAFSHVFIGNRNIPATFGTDGALMWEPGSLQLITFNEYRGPTGLRTFDDDTQKQTVLLDPWVGLPWDYYTTLAACGDWVLGVKLNYKLVGMPTDMFHSGDNQDGNRWTNQLNIVNP